jgi:hypothetical protein
VNPYVYGLIAGAVLALAFICGFLAALKIRFWKVVAEEAEAATERTISRKEEAESRIMERLEIPDEREAVDDSPIGPPPPTPMQVAKQKAVAAFRRREAS